MLKHFYHAPQMKLGYIEEQEKKVHYDKLQLSLIMN